MVEEDVVVEKKMITKVSQRRPLAWEDIALCYDLGTFIGLLLLFTESSITVDLFYIWFQLLFLFL